MSEKPLNVRVAEALGCKPYRTGEDGEDPDGAIRRAGVWRCPCDGPDGKPLHGRSEWRSNGTPTNEEPFEVHPYGEDSPEGWAATGPLLAERCISLYYRAHVPDWTAMSDDGPCARAGKPLEAAALCIIALAEAGRLPK